LSMSLDAIYPLRKNVYLKVCFEDGHQEIFLPN